MKRLLLVLVEWAFGIIGAFVWTIISAAMVSFLFAICFVPIVGLLCGLDWLFGLHWSWGQASALSIIALISLFALSEKEKNKRLEREERERILASLWRLIRQREIIVVSTSN